MLLLLALLQTPQLGPTLKPPQLHGESALRPSVGAAARQRQPEGAPRALVSRGATPFKAALRLLPQLAQLCQLSLADHLSRKEVLRQERGDFFAITLTNYYFKILTLYWINTKDNEIV